MAGPIDTAIGASKKALNSLSVFTSAENKKIGESKSAEQKKFVYDNTLTFPADLGTGLRNPYYITFFVNQQNSSKYKTTNNTAVGKDGQPIQSNIQINQGGIRTLGKNLGGTDLGFGRKTSRTTAAIRLFMPDSLSWGYQNAFQNVSLSGLPYTKLLSAGVALGESAVEGFKKGTIMGVLSSLAKKRNDRNVTDPVAELIGTALLGSGGDAIAASALGVTVNPQIDVIYESPKLRDFTFDFLFAPRNHSEAVTVEKIVQKFKFHAAPELYGQGSGIGRYFVPPSEFDIEFSVPTMGRVSTCVLVNITLDYASSGAAFYTDDYPVYTRMTLQFMELEFMTKELIETEQNGGKGY